MLCSRCVLAEHPPGVVLNEDGVCNLCVEAASGPARGPAAPPRYETDLTRLLKKIPRKGPYDCLVMCSGGKDSTAALYYAVVRYHLKPLAFTFDHGFPAPGAIENVRNAVNRLGVDWMYLRSHYMHDMFARIIRTNGAVPICPVCSLWYMQLTYDVAERYRIPLIMGGWTRGQISSGSGTRLDGNLPDDPEFIGLTRATESFIDDVRASMPRYRKFPRKMAEVQRKHRKIMTISPHWFLSEDPASYRAMITEKLGWKPVGSSYPKGSTNCALNFIGSYLSMKHWGFTHYHIEMSHLIRRGEMSRKEALEALELDLEAPDVRPLVASTLDQLGCDFSDLHQGDAGRQGELGSSSLQ